MGVTISVIIPKFCFIKVYKRLPAHSSFNNSEQLNIFHQLYPPLDSSHLYRIKLCLRVLGKYNNSENEMKRLGLQIQKAQLFSSKTGSERSVVLFSPFFPRLSSVRDYPGS